MMLLLDYVQVELFTHLVLILLGVQPTRFEIGLK